MGYVSPPPRILDMGQPSPADYQATLYTLAKIYDVGNQLLRVGSGARVRIIPPLHYASRTWVDLHIEALGWGLLASVGALIAWIAWVGMT